MLKCIIFMERLDASVTHWHDKIGATGMTGKGLLRFLPFQHVTLYDGVIPVLRHWDPEILVNVKFCVEKCNVFDDYGKPVSRTGMTGKGATWMTVLPTEGRQPT